MLATACSGKNIESHRMHALDSVKSLPNPILDSIIQLLDIPHIVSLGYVNRDLMSRILSSKIDCRWIPQCQATRLLSVYVLRKLFHSKSHPMTPERVRDISEIERRFKINISYFIYDFKCYSLRSDAFSMQMLQTLDVENFAQHESTYLTEKCPLLRSLKVYCIFTDTNLGTLSTLPNLLELDAQDISDANLSSLSSLKVQALNISNSDQVTDRNLSVLSELPLHTLDLSYCKQVTDVGLQFLSHLKLHTLNLSECPAITDLGVYHYLSKLTALHELHLDGCKTTDVALQTLINFTSLKKLSIPHISDAGLDMLSQLELEELCLAFSHLTDDGLILNPFPMLKKLKLEGCNIITDTGVRSLTHLTALKQLEISRCNGVTGSGLNTLTGLEELDLHQQIIKASIGESLKSLAQLQILTVFQIRNEDIGVLAGLTQLHTLHIHSPRIGGFYGNKVGDILRLSQLTRLRTLRLTRFIIGQEERDELSRHFKVIYKPELGF